MKSLHCLMKCHLFVFLIVTIIVAESDSLAQMQIATRSDGDASADSAWFCVNYLENLRGESPAGLSMSVNNIIDSLTAKNLRSFKEVDCVDSTIWDIDTVGTFRGRVVIDIFGVVQCSNESVNYEEKPHEFKRSKAVALETTSGLFRLLYLSSASPGDLWYESSRVILVGGHELLVTKSRRSGQATDYEDDYWIWEASDAAPRRLDLSNMIRKAWDKLTPKGSYAWHGAEFIPEKLTFISTVRCDDCGDPAQARGLLTIRFGFEGNGLRVVDAEYSTDDF